MKFHLFQEVTYCMFICRLIRITVQNARSCVLIGRVYVSDTSLKNTVGLGLNARCVGRYSIDPTITAMDMMAAVN